VERIEQNPKFQTVLKREEAKGDIGIDEREEEEEEEEEEEDEETE
jgi:hypothetical protein